MSLLQSEEYICTQYMVNELWCYSLLLSLIIFATSGGGGYNIFLRSENSTGLSVAECLFFAFAWSVGFNIPTVMDKAFIQLTKCAIIKGIFSVS